MMNRETLPKSFKRFDADTLEIHEGGGCFSLFGLFFLMPGLLMTLVALGVIPAKCDGNAESWLKPVIVIFGFVFSSLGALLVFGRSWVTFDKRQQLLIKRFGLLIPMKRTERPLGAYRHVTITFNRGDSDTSDSYPVEISGIGFENEMLHTSSDYGESFLVACTIAEFLRLPLEDRTTELQVHDFRSPRKSLQERLRTGEEPVEVVSQPDQMKSQVRQTPEGLTIIAPRTRLRRKIFGSMEVVVSPSRMILTEKAASIRTFTIKSQDIFQITTDIIPESDQDLVKYLMKRNAQMKGPEFDKAAAGMSKPWWLNMFRLVVYSRGVVIKTSQGLFCVGSGLSADEIRYLTMRIKQSLM